MLNLKELDLSKADWKAMYHPDIDLDKTYLCFVNRVWTTGKFHKAWYGYYFSPNRGSHSLQFDDPERWHIVYEMEDSFAQIAFPEPPKVYDDDDCGDECDEDYIEDDWEYEKDGEIDEED